MIQIINFPCYVGSYKRLFFPLSKVLNGATIFVEPFEYENYIYAHGKNFNFSKHPNNNMGFGGMLGEILKFSKNLDSEYYLFCDDDIFGFKRRDKNPVDLNCMFNEGVKLCKDNNYSQLMISFSGHNWFFKKEIKEKIGAWCCFIAKTQDLIKCGGYDISLKIFNDWDISAKLLRSGFKTACWYKYMFNHKMMSNHGGAEFVYKKKSNLSESIKILKERYGEKCVKEVNSHGQIEARFNWSKI